MASTILPVTCEPALLRRPSNLNRPPQVILVQKKRTISQINKNKMLTLALTAAFFALDFIFNNGKNVFLGSGVIAIGALLRKKWNDSKPKRFVEVPADEVMSLQPELSNKANESGHLPKYKLDIGNVTYYCSSIFTFQGSFAVLTFIKRGEAVHPQIFYLSHSQAVWRVLPTILNKEGEGIRFGKGSNETDTNLPLNLNFALNCLPQVQDKSKSTDYLFSILDKGYISDRYLSEIETNSFVFSIVPPNTSCLCQSPDFFHLPNDSRLHPNFKKLLRQEELNNPFYGKLVAKVYPSNDGSRHFLFYLASDGKVFFAGLEQVKAPINSFGVRKNADILSKMATPLLEYISQVDRSYRPSDFNANLYNCSNHFYICNWNYIRELQIIKAYYQYHQVPIPETI